MRIGVGLSIPELATRGGKFSPASLFAGGVQGVWYSPDDYSTLFQDSAGTTPVTAVEQPVGLMLDKSQGLVLGSNVVDNFNSLGTGWAWASSVLSKTAGTAGRASDTTAVTAGKWYRVDYTITAVTNGGGGALSVEAGSLSGTSAPSSAPGNYTIYVLAAASNTWLSFYANSTIEVTLTNISVRELPGNHASQATSTSRPVLRARYNTLLATETLATQSVTTLAASYKLAFSGAGSITLSGTATGTYSAGTNTITCTAGTLTLTVSGTVTQADFRLASTATSMPAYQRVTTSTDYATAGFLPYLALSTDDSFGTGSINFSATDKMSVVTGITKLSDAAAGMVTELSAIVPSNNGSFYFAAPELTSPSGDFSISARGTVLPASPVSSGAVAAPATRVATGLFDIAASSRTMRLNGTQVATSSSSMGTGNFGNYPLFIGRRNNASLPFEGRIYGLIVCGKMLSASELSATESWMNSRTGAY